MRRRGRWRRRSGISGMSSSGMWRIRRNVCGEIMDWLIMPTRCRWRRRKVPASWGTKKILMAEEKKLFKVTIDNITIEVEPGTSILNAARRIGGDVAPPAVCYFCKLKGDG